MPYIPKTDRNRIYITSQIPPLYNAGELNYFLTQIINEYITVNGGVNYAKVNDIVGAMECAKLELYRRLAAPYEDKKILENGDVKPYES